MNPVRILVDSFADAGLPNAQMGNAREIVRRLDPSRFHVSIFTVERPDPLIAGRDNTELIQLPQRRKTVRILREFLFGRHQILFYLKSSPASLLYLRIRKPHSRQCTVIGTMESQADLRNEPYVAREAVRMWERTILRSDRLFSNAISVQQSLRCEYGLESEIIPTGVDTTFFTPDWERLPNARPQVLFVGSLRTYKQPQLLLDAAAQFKQADFRLAGDGPLAAELQERVQHEGLANVALLGALDARQLREEYRRADIFLFPSVWEGSPKVILEAAACGLPVIARNSYRPETVVHGETGYQAASREELLGALRGLVDNVQLRRELGRNGRQHSQKYDWDVITERWSATFFQLAEQRELRRVS